MYVNMFFLPYRGPAQKARKIETKMITPAYDRNEGVMTYICISWMFATDDSVGALRTMMTAPTMQRKQATLPIKLSLSFKKKAESTVAITTDIAPRDVTRIASVKAYATKLRISPKIIRLMPAHQKAFFR